MNTPSKAPDNVLQPTQVKSQADVNPLVAVIKNPVESNISKADVLTPENILAVAANNTYNTRNEVSNNISVGDNVTFMTQMGEKSAVWDGEFFQSNIGAYELDLALPIEGSWGFVRNDSQIQKELGTSNDINSLVHNAIFKINLEKDTQVEKKSDITAGKETHTSKASTESQKSEPSGSKEINTAKNSSENQVQQNEWKQAERSQRGIKR